MKLKKKKEKFKRTNLKYEIIYIEREIFWSIDTQKASIV